MSADYVPPAPHIWRGPKDKVVPVHGPQVIPGYQSFIAAMLAWLKGMIIEADRLLEALKAGQRQVGDPKEEGSPGVSYDPPWIYEGDLPPGFDGLDPSQPYTGSGNPTNPVNLPPSGRP